MTEVKKFRAGRSGSASPPTNSYHFERISPQAEGIEEEEVNITDDGFGKSHDSPQGKRSPSRDQYKSSKRGSLPGDVSSNSIREHQPGKRNSLPDGGPSLAQLEQKKDLNKKISSSIALPVVPDPKKRLSNSIAIPGVFDEGDKKNKGSTRSKKDGNSKTSPQSSGKMKLDLNASSDNTLDKGSGKNASQLPSNIDESGQNAKLLSVRRIGNPDRIRKHEEEAGSNSTSSSISETGEAPEVFLPKRYILAIMMFMGFVNMYAVRVNLNVAIGAMVNNHTVVRGGVAYVVVSIVNCCFCDICCVCVFFFSMS